MRGFEPMSGAKTFESATGEPAPIELLAVPAVEGIPTSGTVPVTILTYEDQHLLLPGGGGEFRLISTDGSYQTHIVVVEGFHTFYVPPGRYYVWGNHEDWQLRPGSPQQIDVDTQTVK